MIFTNIVSLSWLLAISRATAASTPTALQVRAAPAVPPCDYKFFTQKIDHYGQCEGEFQQRFSLFTEFFEPGGPIMFYQGEEITHVECGNDTILYEWAKELKGLVVSLEHRYFGASKPVGNESSKIENLKYLTLENVMDDAVEFLGQVKENVTGAADSKVIMASGSYGGFLSGVFRLNRPETIYGALASAGPVMGFGNSTNDPTVYNWNNWVNRVYQDRSIVAARKIQKGFAELVGLVKTNDFPTLQSKLGLCSPPTNQTAPLIPMLLSTIFGFVAEFNYHKARPVSSLIYPLDQAIRIAETEPDHLQVLNRTAWLYIDTLNIPCWDADVKIMEQLISYIEQPYFQYITCTFFPNVAAGYVAEGLLFPPNSNSDAGVPLACQQQFNVTPMTKDEIESRYHLSKEDIQNSKRIIWSRGEYDPASSVEPAELPLDEDRMASRTLFAPRVAHMEDVFRSDGEDPVELTWLRERELEIIKGWLDPVEVFEA
ncbi:unnamed protein product [Periconia digitata]|uniref:Prolylcarboxypeptidase n=1 Tax=Periconia digitata TaxID=1303443 RepID=A0A9W4UDB6_9PLEO|nr:unnamed protein product [Periconia digitata]